MLFPYAAQRTENGRFIRIVRRSGRTEWVLFTMTPEQAQELAREMTELAQQAIDDRLKPTPEILRKLQENRS